MSHQPDLSIVIPAYNEQERLPRFLDSVLAGLGTQETEVIVVDDGSRDLTRELVLERCKRWPNLRLIALAQNCGKGAAVRTGMLAAKGRLVLFADADGATQLTELSRLTTALAGDVKIAIGSREGSGTVVTASKLRRFLGRWFNRAVRLGAIRGLRDTQCGFKLFTAEASQQLFSLCREDGFAFDVEVLYLATKLGIGVVEVPVNWTEIAGSKVRLFRDGLRMLRSVLRIRLRWRTGRYAGLTAKKSPANELTPARA